jgi:hypothetical protein
MIKEVLVNKLEWFRDSNGQISIKLKLVKIKKNKQIKII